MNRKLKITLIVLLILAIAIAIPLIVLSFGRVEPGYIALCYDNIISNYSTTEVFGPGNHFIGVARQFIRIKQGPIMVNVQGSTYTSDYFKLNTKIIVNYQLPSPNDFNSVSSFYENFGDQSENTIQSIINKKILAILSEYPSTFFKNSTYNSTDLETYIATKLSTVFTYDLGIPLSIQVLIESLVVEGASQNIEAIEQQITASLLELERAQNEKTEISNFITKVKDRSLQELSIVYEIIKQRTQLVSSLIDKSANFNANFNLSMFLLGNNLVQNNLTYFNSVLRLPPELYTLNETNVF